MRINERLNLVIPIYGDDENDVVAWVHSTPISRDVFDAHYLLIAKTFSVLHTQRLGEIAGPRIAANVLRDQARELTRTADDADAVLHPLLAEIHRLTNVLLPTSAGWETHTYDQVLSRKLLSPEDVSEVESAVTFFTVISLMHKRVVARQFLEGAARLWGAQLTSSNVTGWAASLPTLTAPATSSATAASTSPAVSPVVPTSSVPS